MVMMVLKYIKDRPQFFHATLVLCHYLFPLPAQGQRIGCKFMPVLFHSMWNVFWYEQQCCTQMAAWYSHS